MPNPMEIENIEEMRRNEGIDDVELRLEIRGLKVGAFVKLTALSGAASFATLLVRVTSIRESVFRGKVEKKPRAAGLSKLPLGSSLVFTAAHIHSVVKRNPTKRKRI